MESPTCGKTALIHQTREILTSKPTFIKGVSEKLLQNGKHKSPLEHTFLWRLAQFELEINNVVFPVFSNFSGHPVFITLVKFPGPGQLSKVKSRLPGNFFELVPGVVRGMHPVGIDWGINYPKNFLERPAILELLVLALLIKLNSHLREVFKNVSLFARLPRLARLASWISSTFLVFLPKLPSFDVFHRNVFALLLADPTTSTCPS